MLCVDIEKFLISISIESNQIQFHFFLFSSAQNRIGSKPNPTLKHAMSSIKERCGLWRCSYERHRSRVIIPLFTHYSIHTNISSGDDVVVMDLVFNFPHNLVTLHSIHSQIHPSIHLSKSTLHPFIFASASYVDIGSFNSFWMLVMYGSRWYSEMGAYFCTKHLKFNWFFDIVFLSFGWSWFISDYWSIRWLIS